VKGDQSIGDPVPGKALTDLLDDLAAAEHQLSQSIDGTGYRPSEGLTACGARGGGLLEQLLSLSHSQPGLSGDPLGQPLHLLL